MNKLLLIALAFVSTITFAEGLKTSGVETCADLYGVAKTNCIQDVNAGRKDNIKAASAEKTSTEPCTDLYGVAKTNCMQDVNVGRKSMSR